MSSSITIIDAARQIYQNPAPVIMLDTCLFLDIIRVPIRAALPPETIMAAMRLLKGADPDPVNRALWLVITEIVEKEWISNLEKVLKEVEQDIETTDRQHRAFFKIIPELHHYSPTPYPAQTAVSLGSLNILSKLEQLSTDMVDRSLLLQMDNDVAVRASRRVVDSRRPAKKGANDSYRDCDIVESFIGLAIELRNLGFSDKICFSTSNKGDFCSSPGKIHPDLEKDFQKAGIEFFPNLPSIAFSL